MVTSAGLLLYRVVAPGDGREARRGPASAAPIGQTDRQAGLHVFVAHMGGPFWRSRPRAWSIPKGELETLPDGSAEAPIDAATREFAEEIGVPAPDVPYRELGTFRQASGKRVVVFAGASTLEVDAVRSVTFELELPRGSGRLVPFPEIDDARWVPVAEARELLVAGQVAALDALVALLAVDADGRPGTVADL